MTIGQAIVNRYSKMGSSLMTHHKLLSAKGALIRSAIPHPLKLKMINGYRTAEKSLFGRTTNLPGELGVQGMGTTFGMRQQLRRAGESEATQSTNPSPTSDTGTSDLYQSILSRFSGDPSQVN